MIRDIHVHVQMGMPLKETAEYLKYFKEKENIEKIAILSVPTLKNVSRLQNLRILAIKDMLFPYSFAFFGFWHGEGKKDYFTQLKEAVDEGFEGLKILESKPDIQKALGIRMYDERFDDCYSYLEETGLPVLMHVADPATSWDKNKIDKWALEHGRCYDGPGFLSREELYADIEKILDKHPKLNLTLAHFYFMSEELDRADDFLTRHPNVKFDITPGKEMFLSFTREHEKSVAFFNKYADRILLGTDVNDSDIKKYHESLYFLTTEMMKGTKEFEMWGNTYKPLGLSSDVCENIFRGNAIRCVGKEPKPVNCAAIMKEISEIEKTESALSERDREELYAVKEYFSNRR